MHRMSNGSKGKLFLISGPSGVGKGTVMKSLKNAHDINLSVSATTREPRKDEVHGVNYYYVSKDEFDFPLTDNDLVEYYAEHMDSNNEFVSKRIKGNAL